MSKDFKSTLQISFFCFRDEKLHDFRLLYNSGSSPAFFFDSKCLPKLLQVSL